MSAEMESLLTQLEDTGAQQLTIFADNDDSGRGQKAAHRLATRWRAAGREARTAMPPEQE